jgi:hypothetical protein
MTERVRVWQELSVTLNLGNYESVKVTEGGEAWADDSAVSRQSAESKLNKQLLQQLVARAEELREVVSGPATPVRKKSGGRTSSR